MSDESPLSITRDGPVVRAVMDRPARRNALAIKWLGRFVHTRHGIYILMKST